MSSEKMSNSVEEVSKILAEWDRENNTDEVIIGCLMKLADLFEAETKAFLKKDPDPFDDRHPSRLHPDCTLGHMLKSVFRNERIVDEIVKVYCQRDVFDLNLASCRLLLDILPGLESVIFEEEGFVSRLFHWAEIAPNPLQSYATGLLGAAMDSSEIATSFKEKNAYFVPLMIRRLHDCSARYLRNPVSDEPIPERPFACLGGNSNHNSLKHELDISAVNDAYKNSTLLQKSRKPRDASKSPRYSPFPSDARSHHRKHASKQMSPVKNSLFNEGSNSNWTEQYVVGQYQVYPLTIVAEQRYILHYLTPMGEYQETLAPIFEEKALPLILRYIDIHQNPDVRLSFEALKYLSSLLCHKKIALEFINIGGLQLLLKVPYPSIAATGVSICMYYLAYTEEVMEKICCMPTLLSELISYALWLLECSHDSSRCHATMFFGWAFAFKIALDCFDQQDGLRKLFNVMSTLEMFVQNSTRTLSDDQIFANRQTTRHVCGALKRYFEAHLVAEIERVHQVSSMHRSVDFPKTKPYKALNLSYEVVDSYCEIWRDIMPLNMNWKPVDDFIHLEAVTFLLDLISSYFDLNYSGRPDTVTNALDALKICSLTSATQLVLCEQLSSQENPNVKGIHVLLQAVDEDILPMPNVQRAALHCIINCVCTKIPNDKAESNSASKCAATPRKKSGRSVEELLNKLWRCIRVKNGIMILINLLGKKTPLTDADSIRALACRALCGLSRMGNVQQIISKLPLITDGLLLEYMKQPVLQDKGHEHVKFCKFGLELITRVTSAPLNDSSESSMMNINKKEIVANTKIMYNEAQLLQLISDHLSSKGFNDTVACLQKEMANKSIVPQPLPSNLMLGLVSNTSKPVSTPLVNSSSARSFRNSEVFSSPNCVTTPVASIPPPSVPLKIILNKKLLLPEAKPISPSRLQKQEKCSGSYVQTPAMKRQGVAYYPYGEAQPSISLEAIISEYLRKQHALCKNPMLACPPFDLYVPHKCPESKNKTRAPTNCVLRLHKKMYGDYAGYGASSLDRKFIYSKFRLCRTFRDEEDGRLDFVCSSFLNYDEPILQPRIVIGTQGSVGHSVGTLKVYNIGSGEEESTRDAHTEGVYSIHSSKFSPLVLTSDNVGSSSLWNSNGFEVVRDFAEVRYMEFAKTSASRMVGTKQDSAVIFDTNTGSVVQEFFNGDSGNQYSLNRSTFDYRDEFMLSDGLLWDIRSKAFVHKLDKFNANENGVFHPNGREIISNSEIWDMRTFKLLRTVVGLDSCRITFNDTGSVLYGIYYKPDSNEEKANCFYTFNANDYTPIATMDMKKPVFHLSVDCNDKYIATVESQFADSNDILAPIVGEDCVCRLYEIGRAKELDDEDGEESDSEEETNDGDDDDDIVEFEELGNDDENQNDDDDDDLLSTLYGSSISTITESSSDSSDERDTFFSINNILPDVPSDYLTL